jgi:hypothetical protein
MSRYGRSVDRDDDIPDLDSRISSRRSLFHPTHNENASLVDLVTLPRRSRVPITRPLTAPSELAPAPGVGLHHPIPEIEMRSLSIYQPFCEEAAYVATV